MRIKSFILLLQALVISALMSVSVSATTISPSGGSATHPLDFGIDYSGGRSFVTGAGDGFKDIYRFKATTAAATAADFSGSFKGGGFSALKVEWLDGSTVIFAFNFLDYPYPSGFDLALPLIFGKKYNLVISGALTKGGPGGSYAFDVTAVPLPPAALLLLSGLIGIGALGRRRRGAKKVSV
jgi:hypothetical protein